MAVLCKNRAIPSRRSLRAIAQNTKRMRRSGSRVWLCGVLLSAGLLLAGCSVSSGMQQSFGCHPDEIELGMSIDDVLELCGRPVGKAMYVENGIRYDQLIYIGVARSENWVITTVTFEDGVLTRQEVEIEGTPLSLHCNHH